MDDLPVARRELYRREVAVLSEVGGDNEAAIEIAVARRHLEAALGRQDHVGRAQRPRLGPLPRQRELFRLSLRRPGRDPVADRCDLRLAEPPGIQELAEARDGLPGRHLPPLDDAEDLLPLAVRVDVAQERKGRDVAGAMAALAMLLEDRGDLLAPRHHTGAVVGIGRGLTGRGGQTRNEADPHYDSESDEQPAGSHDAGSSPGGELLSMRQAVGDGRDAEPAPAALPVPPSPAARLDLRRLPILEEEIARLRAEPMLTQGD